MKAGRFYENVRTLWVDPVTGSIINGKEQQKQTLRVDGEVKADVVEASVGLAPTTLSRRLSTTRSPPLTSWGC